MAPQPEMQSAREALDKRGIPYSAEQFLRHVRAGNLEIVDHFLAAGMPPDTSLDGESATAAAASAGHKEICARLIRAGADPESVLDYLKPQPKRKDLWEKLASISGVFTFTSSLLIAGVGWYFTSQYNQRQFEEGQRQAEREQASRDYQNRLAEMQTVERMIPHLAKDETSRQAALVAISVLASPSVAARMAEVYGGQASVSALTQIAAANPRQSGAAVSALTTIAGRGSEADAAPARAGLAKVLEGQRRAVVKLMVGGSPMCNGFVVEGAPALIATPGYCIQAAGGKEIVVHGAGDAAMKVRSIRRSPDGLVAFIDAGAHGLPGLRLSRRQIVKGDNLLQLAFDLMEKGSELKVNLGTVLAVLRTAFVGAGEKVEATAYRVALDSPRGSGGGPLLDSEGNVACMTFQGTAAGRMEECLPASHIRESLNPPRGN